MRVGLINSLINNTVNFSGISIGNVSKRHEKTSSQVFIEDAKRKLKHSPATDSFKKSLQDYQNVADITKNNDPYYDITNQDRLKRTLDIKASILDAQHINLANMREEAQELMQIPDELTKQLEQIDSIRREENAKIAGFRYGAYRTGDGFSQLAGYEKEKNGVKANVPSSVLFFGPRGNGKSTFADAFSQELGCETSVFLRPFGRGDEEKCDNLYSKMLEKAQTAKEEYETSGKITVITLNELDVIQNGSKETIKKISEFLKTCYPTYHCILFASTNYPLNIPFQTGGKDTAFPCVVAVDPPNRENKKAILKYYLEGKLAERVSEDDYYHLADMLEKQEAKTGGAYSASQIKNEVCKSDDKGFITNEDVVDSIEHDKVKPNLTKEYLTEFQTAYKKLMTNEIEE